MMAMTSSSSIDRRRSTIFDRPPSNTMLLGRTAAAANKNVLKKRHVRRSAMSVKLKLEEDNDYRTISRSDEQDADSDNHSDVDNAGNEGSRKKRLNGSPSCSVEEDSEPGDSYMTLIVFLNMISLVLETSMPDVKLWDLTECLLFISYLLVFTCKLFMMYAPCPCRQPNLQSSAADTSLDAEKELIDRDEGIHEDNKMVGFRQNWWNIFDLGIIFFGMLDLLLSFYQAEHHFRSKWHERLIADVVQLMKVLRVCRLFRLIKKLKSSKIKCLTWVKVHWKGFLVGTYAVGSCAIFLILFVIICAMFLVLTVGQVPQDDPDYEIFHDRMGNLWSASVTLFQLMVEPNFAEFINLIEYWPPRPIFSIFLFFFIMLGNFGFLTMLNGVVTQEITEYNEDYMETRKAEWEHKLRAILKETSQLFFRQDKQSAPLEDFLQRKAEFEKIFKKHGLHYAEYDMETMLAMLNVENTGNGEKDRVEKLDFEYFIEQLVLGMRPMLAMQHFYETVTTKKKVERIEEQVKDVNHKLKSMSSKIDQLISSQIHSTRGGKAEEEETGEENLVTSENSMQMSSLVSSSSCCVSSQENRVAADGALNEST